MIGMDLNKTVFIVDLAVKTDKELKLEKLCNVAGVDWTEQAGVGWKM